MIFLTTERLVLRSLIPSDAEVMFDYRNNEICARYQRGQVKTLEEIQKLVERRANDRISGDQPFMIAVALKESNEMIGEVVVMPKDEAISLGYTFSYRYHRQGYAYEALSPLIDLLHETFPDWEFICFTEVENEASMALLKKLGYMDLGYVEKVDSQMFGKFLK